MPIEGFNLDDFTSVFEGGARSYLFMYIPTFPFPQEIKLETYLDITGDEESIDDLKDSKMISYHVRSTTLPESNVEELILNWQGLDFKVAGKRSYLDWTITFNVDINYEIREDFEQWVDKISSKDGHGDIKQYMQDQTLYLLNGEGTKVSTVKLVDAWPKNVGAVSLDYSAMDIAQFDVTFSYQYHEITK